MRALPRIGFTDFLAAATLWGTAIWSGSRAGDPGVGWHLRTGQWIIEHRQIPAADPFLWTSGGKSLVCTQWLSDVMFWFLYRAGGWPLLQILCMAACMAAYFLIPAGRLYKRGKAGPWVITLAVLSSAIVGCVQWFVRPVVFSFLLFAAVHAVVSDYLEGGGARRPWLLPAIFLLWANLHSAFVLGLFVIAAAVVDSAWNEYRAGEGYRCTRQLLAVLMFAGMATLVNPYGIKLHANMLALVTEPFFMHLNSEWFSPDFTDSVFKPFAISVLVLLALWPSGARLRPFNMILLLVFLWLGLSQRRYIPFYGLVLCEPLAQMFSSFAGDKKGKPLSRLLPSMAVLAAKDLRATRLGYTSVVFIALVFCALLGVTIPPRDLGIDSLHPQSAVERLASAAPGSKILHTPDWGGYLVWKLWPRQQAYIDDRNELSGVDLYKEYLQLANLKPGWQETLTRREFEYALLTPSEPLAQALPLLGGWKQIFSDDKSVLFQRSVSSD